MHTKDDFLKCMHLRVYVCVRVCARASLCVVAMHVWSLLGYICNTINQHIHILTFPCIRECCCEGGLSLNLLRAQKITFISCLNGCGEFRLPRTQKQFIQRAREKIVLFVIEIYIHIYIVLKIYIYMRCGRSWVNKHLSNVQSSICCSFSANACKCVCIIHSFEQRVLNGDGALCCHQLTKA